MYYYHSFPELEQSLLECEYETKKIPQIREYICWKDTRYIFYLLFLLMVILFLIFIAIVITNYSSK